MSLHGPGSGVTLGPEEELHSDQINQHSGHPLWCSQTLAIRCTEETAVVELLVSGPSPSLLVPTVFDGQVRQATDCGSRTPLTSCGTERYVRFAVIRFLLISLFQCAHREDGARGILSPLPRFMLPDGSNRLDWPTIVPQSSDLRSQVFTVSQGDADLEHTASSSARISRPLDHFNRK